VAEKIHEDTIVAISTPPGEGGIGIVRISGQRALEIVQDVFAGVRGHDLDSVSSHSLCYGHIVHPETSAIIDEVLLSVYLRGCR
jgi:tRNA modification GTPase